MGVSKNNGTLKSFILIGFSIINHPFLGYPYFWKHPYGLLIHLGCEHWNSPYGRQDTPQVAIEVVYMDHGTACEFTWAFGARTVAFFVASRHEK